MVGPQHNSGPTVGRAPSLTPSYGTTTHLALQRGSGPLVHSQRRRMLQSRWTSLGQRRYVAVPSGITPQGPLPLNHLLPTSHSYLN